MGRYHGGGRPKGAAPEEAIAARVNATARARQQPWPEKKRCTKCKKWKSTVRDFTTKRRKLRDGGYSYYPASTCKQCDRERAAAWKASKSSEELAEAQRRWNRSRKKRKGAGATNSGRSEAVITLDAEPLLRWAEPRADELRPSNGRRLRESRLTGRISVRVADAILTDLGDLGMLATLYGE